MADKLLRKIPPHNIEAEQSVLGSIMIDEDAISVAVELLRPEDFYRKDHASIYESVLDLYNDNKPVDLITIKNVIDEKGLLDKMGGIDYLSKLIDILPTSARIKHYANIVHEKAMLRKIIKMSDKIMGLGYEGKEDIEMILDSAEKDIFNLNQNRNTEDFSSIRDVLMETFEQIEKVYNSDEDVTGVSTGFVELDHKTSGFQRSDLLLLAARPSMGKTAIALNLVQHVGVKDKIPVAIFSLEMSKAQLINRMLSAEAMVDAQKLRTGNLDQNDWVSITKAMGPLSEAPIYIDDTPGITVHEMRTKCRKLKMEKGLGLIMIDYLQLMSGSGKIESRQQEISEISRSLKGIARELDVPVLALSQLSRACESRADHRPMLSDL